MSTMKDKLYPSIVMDWGLIKVALNTGKIRRRLAPVLTNDLIWINRWW